jgi:hypothetical protein
MSFANPDIRTMSFYVVVSWYTPQKILRSDATACLVRHTHMSYYVHLFFDVIGS